MSGSRKKQKRGRGPDKRFMRGTLPPRMSPQRRRRRLLVSGTAITLLTLLAITAGWVSGTQALHCLRSSPAFGVVDLQINDCPQVDHAELTVLNHTRDRRVNIFSIHLGRLAREVEQHRWVETCSIKRVLPDKLRVRIEQKTPAMLVRHGERLLLVDQEGDVIEEPPASESWADRFPLLTGFDGDTAWEVYQGRVRNNLPLVELLLTMEQSRAIPRVAEIETDETNNVRIYFAGREYPVLLGDNAYADQLARYRLLEKTLEERHGNNLKYVDLRFRDRVVVKPIEGTGEEGRS